MFVRVKVSAGRRRERIRKTATDHIEISVKEPAMRGAANRRVKELVAEMYQVPVQKVRMVSGHHSPSKLLELL